MNISLPEPSTVSIEGIPFAALTMRDVVNFIIRRHSENQGGWVITPNIDILRRLLVDPSFLSLVLGNATLYLADGAPIVWLSHLAGNPLPERVAGSDLFVELVSEAALNGKSIYLLGGNPGVAEVAIKILKNKFTNLNVAGWYAPPFGFENNPNELENIRQLLLASRADIIFVGLGSPKQEQLIATMKVLLPKSWWLGIGVSFSFLAGDVKRAPVWMRKIGLEWLHRVLQEPKRLFKRYFIIDMPFALGLFVRILLKRIRSAFKS